MEGLRLPDDFDVTKLPVPNTIQDLQALVALKDDIEADIALTKANIDKSGLGLRSSFVDSEGFPIVDFDKVIQAKDNRSRYQRLQNDHQLIMLRIETGLANVHAYAKENNLVSTTVSAPAPSKETEAPKVTEPTETPDPFVKEVTDNLEMESKYAHMRPFAKIDSVAHNSPAMFAKLMPGDQIYSFGGINLYNGGLSGIKDVVLSNENKDVDIVIYRENKFRTVTMVPKKWEGQGLIGCRLLPA